MDNTHSLDLDTPFDYTQHVDSWNDLALEPWRIRSVYQSTDGNVVIVVKRKNLEHELLDWFEDMRLGAVVRGEKILNPDDFWHSLYKEAIPKIQKHFKPLVVRIIERPTVACNVLLWGSKVQLHHSKDEQPKSSSKKYRIRGKH